MWVNQLFQFSVSIFSLWGQQIKIFKWDRTFISVCDRPLNFFSYYFYESTFFPTSSDFWYQHSTSSSSTTSSSFCLLFSFIFLDVRIFVIYIIVSVSVMLKNINLHISRRYGAKQINKKKILKKHNNKIRINTKYYTKW